jgi:hypothetical protein
MIERIINFTRKNIIFVNLIVMKLLSRMKVTVDHD